MDVRKDLSFHHIFIYLTIFVLHCFSEYKLKVSDSLWHVLKNHLKYAQYWFHCISLNGWFNFNYFCSSNSELRFRHCPNQEQVQIILLSLPLSPVIVSLTARTFIHTIPKKKKHENNCYHKVQYTLCDMSKICLILFKYQK